MKKTLNNIFDEATANELEKLVNQNAASDVSADILSSIKNKVYAKTGITKAKTKKSIAFRWRSYVAVAACFALIIGAILVVPVFQDSGDDPIFDPLDKDIPSISTMISGNNDSIIDPPDKDIPPISTVISGNKITGKQELVYGEPSSENEGEADMIWPGFEIQTVIEAEVTEVLPDTYCYATSYYLPFHVAKLRVVDQIRGEGLPEEIFLCYPYYDTDVFEGYGRFIMSLKQVGVENYMLVNETQGRIDYFSNMFEVIVTRNLGYGSVIAFNDGKVDESFWDKVTDHYIGDAIKSLFGSEYYPVDGESTINQAKENILKLAQEGHVWDKRCDYITVDDVFISAEGKEIQAYVAPSSTSVFMQTIYIREDRIIAEYTRVINGFLSDEKIIVNGYTGENGNVLRHGESYTAEDLAKVPNIGEALENMKLSELDPPHIEIAEGMNFSHSNATGAYRKVNGKIYGIIRVLWYYNYPDHTCVYQKDDLYYLYDNDGKGSIVERDELKAIIGDDSFIRDFSYDSIFSRD